MKLSLDSHKLMYHLDTLVKWLRGDQIYPLYCQISLTKTCNYRCIFCVYSNIDREKVYTDAEKILIVIKELGRNGLKAMFISGEGEPLLHRNIVKIIETTKSYGIDCALNTNGFYLSKDMSEKILRHLTFVRVSINGCGKKNYRAIHNAPINAYERILNNFRSANEIREKYHLRTTIGAQCILLNENVDYIWELAKDLRECGVDYLAFKPFLPMIGTKYRTGLDLKDNKVVEQLNRCEQLSDDNFKVIVRWDSISKITKRNYERCLSVPFMIEIDCQGDVYTCGVLLGNKEYAYGNIYDQTFNELLNSEKYRRTVNKIYNELDIHKCMPNCRNDAVNRFLWGLKHPPEHVNFI